MSGSLTEMLNIWDLLRGVDTEKLFTRVLDHHKNSPDTRFRPVDPMDRIPTAEANAMRARAAGGAAMLVGCGYHGAVELMESLLKYFGQDPRPEMSHRGDAADLFGSGAATSILCDLFKAHQQA